MNLRLFYQSLCRFYPEADACPDDIDGLQLCPDADREIRRVVCALDLCTESVNEAIAQNADLLLTHHPVFYGGVHALDPDMSPEAKNAIRLISAGIAHISLHTRFDAGTNGLNETLAKRLNLKNVSAIGLADETRLLGRIGDLEAPLTSMEFAELVARALSTDVLFTQGSDTVRRVLVVTGGGKSYADLFYASDADAFVSGELSHHVRISAANAGKNLYEAGHYGTEILFIEAIKSAISAIDPSVQILPFADTPREKTVLFTK